ncbi:acyl-CoA dehydrogenase family protein [Polyangium aurulentum]|uniref:acyl-CoA dehydrogenase family protein n=1 Tax=Polyangium aurulentum TaxID=2567896 RepID=UPI0010ADFD04|nr:acyl-CoA dehydrogenase family protein [Polyangium aurulentum]UQA60331.1 acyl-CoA/acyl-ACP dehydrogenase [Polyangium aurulentum]
MTNVIPDDFGYGEEQAMLRREARKVLEGASTTAAVRGWMETPAGFDEGMWRTAAEAGWLGLAVPAEHGGSGLGAVSLAVLMEEMGRALLPLPFFGALFTTLVLNEAGSDAQKAQWLPDLAEGKLFGAVGTEERAGGWDHAHVEDSARREGDGILLSGQKDLVVDAPSANLVIATFREEAGPSLFAVEARSPGVTLLPDELVDATRRSGAVQFGGVRVGEEARIGAPGAALSILGRVMPRIWAALAAEMVGGADRLLSMTVEYAKIRQQFGRAIGAFQAVKHPLVDVLARVEMTRSLVYRAAAAIDHAPAEGERLARMAKAIASDTYALAAAKAVQLHGGIGFTWECDVQLYFKRAQWSRAAFGDAAHHRRRIAEMVIGG